MKKITVFILIAVSLCLSACSSRSTNPNIAALPNFASTTADRLVVTNCRYAGKYTIATASTIGSIKKQIMRAKEDVTDSLLEPDFMFEFYSGSKRIATFYYTAKITDKDVANMKDENGRLYRISTNVEQSFMKRIMKSGDTSNVEAYYTSIIKKIIEKTAAQSGAVVVVDITNDNSITKSMTSIEQKQLLDNINTKGIKLKFPSEVESWDYYITIKTKQYSNENCKSTVTVQEATKQSSVVYSVEGSFESEWEYHIQYK